jgi:AraC-like DNA-binding protein
MSGRNAYRLNEQIVSTILTPDERIGLDAASLGIFRAIHRSSVKELIADIHRGDSQGIVISVRFYESYEHRLLEKVVRETPNIPTVALLSRATEGTVISLVRLGNIGVKHVVDTRLPEGWHELRRYLLNELNDKIDQYANDHITKYSESISSESAKFLKTVFHISRNVSTVRQFAGMLDLLPSTLMSQFFRAGLPAPKKYLAMARLVRAAYLFESKGFSVANVANHLGYSSPQSFGRHIRLMMGMTAVEFRHEYALNRMMKKFEESLINPFLHQLYLFHLPLE